MERIWRGEGLKVPQNQKPRGHLWLNDGSCVRLRSERPNHVWSYDFMSAFTHDGRMVRFLNLIDEYTRECLTIHADRRINSNQVIDVLADAMIEHGIPEYIRSDNGPEFVAKELRKWLAKTGAKALYIELGSPWENGYCESFNSKMRDEFLNGEILGGTGVGGTLARLLQHRAATLFAGLQTTSAGSVADRSFPAEWESGKQKTLPTFPHRLLLRRADIHLSRCVTLKISLAQITGQAKSIGLDGESPEAKKIPCHSRRIRNS